MLMNPRTVSGRLPAVVRCLIEGAKSVGLLRGSRHAPPWINLWHHELAQTLLRVLLGCLSRCNSDRKLRQNIHEPVRGIWLGRSALLPDTDSLEVVLSIAKIRKFKVRSIVTDTASLVALADTHACCFWPRLAEQTRPLVRA